MKLLKLLFLLGIVFIVLKVSGVNVFTGQPDTTKYQALFLTNGQVYFGKLDQSSTLLGKDFILTNVYYFQAAQGGLNTSTSSSELSLIKLGSELHGPENKLVINRTSVLFWENLKTDSKVVEAITNFQKKQ